MKKVTCIWTIACCLWASLSFSEAHAKTGFDDATLVYAWSTHVGPLHPHDYGANMMFAQGLVYEPLVQYGKGGNIEPCLATSWTVSPDKKTYTFTLRENVFFSDGEPFTAEAVVKNFDAVLANRDRHAWMELIRRIDSYKALDSHSFSLTLTNPYAAALQELTFVRPLRFLSPRVLAQMETDATTFTPVGTGAWVWQERKKGQYDVFVRHENFWNKASYTEKTPNKLVIKVIPDAEARAVALETGGIDIMATAMGDHGTAEVNPEAYALFVEDTSFAAQISEARNTRLLAMNSGREVLNDIQVRKAIMRAIDRKGILQGVLLGQELPAEALMSSSLPYCDVALTPYPYDVQAAANLLDAAGWKVVAGEKFRQKDGKPLRLSIKFVANESLMRSIAQVAQSNLAAIGIDVQLVGEEGIAFMESQAVGDFDIIFANSSGAPYAPFSYLGMMQVPGHAEHWAQKNIAEKPALDAAMKKAVYSTEEADIQKNFADVWRIIHEAEVYIPLSYTVDKALFKKDRLAQFAFEPVSYELGLHKVQLR